MEYNNENVHLAALVECIFECCSKRFMHATVCPVDFHFAIESEIDHLVLLVRLVPAFSWS